MKKRKRGRIYIRNQYKKYLYNRQKALGFSFDVVPQTPVEEKDLDMSYEVDSKIPESMHRFCKVRAYLPKTNPINTDLAAKLRVGSKVRMFWPPGKSWSKGVVSCVYGTGMFTVDFDDDDKKGPLSDCLRSFHFKILEYK